MSLIKRLWSFRWGARPQGAIYLEGVKKDMSVLRKRSPWAIPVASLLMGALTLGLAGCGGGDDSFPNNNPTPGPIPLPLGVTPSTFQATNPTPVVKGQGATVKATGNPDLTGGITDVSIAIPPGALQEDGTIGVEIIPTAQSTFAKIKAVSPASVSGIEPVFELAFGPVEANGNINTSRPIVFGGGGATISINQRGGEFGRLNGLIQSGQCRLVVRRFVEGTGYVVVTDCTAELVRNIQSIVLTGNCSGDILVTCDSVHRQGGVG
jgi:hypothetical protein